MYSSAEFKSYITQTVQLALMEDLGISAPSLITDSRLDLTASLIDETTKATATLISREKAIICGQAWVNEVFSQLNKDLKVNWLVNEGEQVEPNQTLLELQGNARAILTGERTAMNFLQTLSGTATITAEYAKQLEGTQCKVLDTRKTIPGLRLAQKYAVTVGGGENHRVGLYDAFLIKENHIFTAGGIAKAIENARKISPATKCEVETENLDELNQALNAGADVIMLDNFSMEDMKTAVEIRNVHSHHALLEASGNVTLKTLSDIARTGVDFISVGALTKHVKAIDLSLRVTLLL